MFPPPDSNDALYPPWCLIESDPETFQGMSHMYGVGGIQVQEVLNLDDLLTVDRQVYGLIMSSALDFKTTSEQKNDIDPDAASLFFSCQVVTNVCATSALLGVLLNIEDNDLAIGEDLKQFKNFTKDFSPVDRGMAIANSSLLQKTHNTFASFESKMAAKQYPQYRDIKPGNYPEDDHHGYHFVAFIPAKGYVWELDGYNRAPIKLHRITHNWLENIVSELKERMSESGDVNFNMLAVTKSTGTTPLPSSSHNPMPPPIPPPEQRSIAVQRTYQQLMYRIEGYLDIICHDWRQHTIAQHIAMNAAHTNLLTELPCNGFTNPDDSIARLIHSTANRASVISLLQLYEQAHYVYATTLESTMLRSNVSRRDEPPVETFDQDKALLRRQHDYGPFIDALFTKLDAQNIL